MINPERLAQAHTYIETTTLNGGKQAKSIEEMIATGQKGEALNKALEEFYALQEEFWNERGISPEDLKPISDILFSDSVRSLPSSHKEADIHLGHFLIEPYFISPEALPEKTSEDIRNIASLVGTEDFVENFMQFGETVGGRMTVTIGVAENLINNSFKNEGKIIRINQPKMRDYDVELEKRFNAVFPRTKTGETGQRLFSIKHILLLRFIHQISEYYMNGTEGVYDYLDVVISRNPEYFAELFNTQEVIGEIEN